MKIYIKNMVCRGTRLLIIQELERPGFSYNAIELGMIDFKKDLSLNELNELYQALNQYGLMVTFRDIRIVSEIRYLIHELVENKIQLWNDFSNYIIQKFGYNYSYLDEHFKLETGFSIENYYIENSNEREGRKENDNLILSPGTDMLNSFGNREAKKLRWEKTGKQILNVYKSFV